MAYEIIPNAILFVAIAGVLGMFFRHVPEAVEAGSARPQKKRADSSIVTTDSAVSNKNNAQNVNGKWYTKDLPALFARTTGVVAKPVKRVGAVVGKKAWQFMLEAKDLKQGQILASKFARMVTPSSMRYTSPAVHTPMTDAEDLVAAGKLDEAELKYFEVLKKFPHEYTAYEGLVKIYLEEKQYENLSETLEYLVRHVPENDSYWAQYGNVLMSMRQYSQAITALEKSVELNHLIPARYANLGLSYQAIGDINSAAENFKKACELEPSTVQYLIMYTDALSQLGQKERALEILGNALEMLPNDKSEIEKQMEKINHLQSTEK